MPPIPGGPEVENIQVSGTRKETSFLVIYKWKQNLKLKIYVSKLKTAKKSRKSGNGKKAYKVKFKEMMNEMKLRTKMIERSPRRLIAS